MALLSVIVGILVALLAAALLVTLYFVLATRRIAREAERRVPPGGRFVAIDGNLIHYVESGEGKPILMIHGLGGHLHHMRRPLMEQFGDGYRLIAMDRPGSGYSTRAAGLDGRLSEQAGIVVRFIEELGLEKPLLVGHSLGGAIALAVALDHPGAISGLALISPLTHFEEDPPEEFRALAIHSPLRRRIVANTIAVPMSVRNAPRTLDFVFGPQKPPVDYAIEGGAVIGLRPGHFYGTATDLVAIEHDLPRQQTHYGEIRMPAGIFFGTEDRVLDYRRQGLSMEGRIDGLDLEIAEGIGHMPQYVVTDWVIAFVRRIAERAFSR